MNLYYTTKYEMCVVCKSAMTLLNGNTLETCRVYPLVFRVFLWKPVEETSVCSLKLAQVFHTISYQVSVMFQM